MGVYKRSIITEAGNQVLAKAVAGELALNFSHARTSSYAYAEGTDYTKLTSLQEVKQEIIPSNVKVINDTTVSVRLLFGNEAVESAYLIQNIGLYVMDGDEERLFSVSAAIQPDQMPAYDGVAPSSFIYNVSLPVSQAESMTLQINPAGTATTEDILELEESIQGLEESKVTGDGGSISDTETAVEEPTSAADKYPEIQASGGTTKTIFGKLARWVKSLKADKVDVSGGDIKDTKVSEFTASTAQWPVPAAGEAPKTLWGKVKKFCEDFKTWSAGVCLLAQLVSNTTTNNANLPASAAAVYQLAQAMLGYAPKAHASSATTYGAGNASNFGHVKLSDNYTSSAGAAANGVAASSKALADAYSVLNTKKLGKVTYGTRSAATAEQAISTSGTIMHNNEPEVPFDCYVIAHYHLLLESTSSRAAVYWILSGAYIQGNESWNGSVSSRHSFDKTFIFEAAKGQTIQLTMTDSNGVGIKSLGNNTSWNRYSFLFIPK